MTDQPTDQQSFFEQVEQETAHSPILTLLFRQFRHRQDVIYQMKDQRPDDEALLDFIGNAFGIWGGGSLDPEGWYEYKGGKKPHLEIQDGSFNTIHKLEGRQLVSAFRSVFKIGTDQLRLF